MRYFSNKAVPNAERGGALLVAMILIFLLSVMGISSMRGSTLERRMASNSIQTATTFQAAESTSEVALNNVRNLEAAISQANFAAVDSGQADKSGVVPVEIDLAQGKGIESKAQLKYVGYGPAYGFSAGFGSNNFIAFRFEVTAVAKAGAVHSSAGVTQGAYRIVPGQNQ